MSVRPSAAQASPSGDRLRAVLAAGRCRDDSADTQAAMTRSMARLELVRMYMPTLAELQNAVIATHRLFLYLDRNSEASDAWAYSWRAGNVDDVPYNHFGCINFMESNRAMIEKAMELVVPLKSKIENPGSLTQDETLFLQSWLIANKMLSKLDELNDKARIWNEMREEYGEWAPPRER